MRRIEVAEITCEHCGGRGAIPVPAELRNRRERAGLTLAKLAESWKVSIGYLSDVERGKRTLSPRVRELYEELL